MADIAGLQSVTPFGGLTSGGHLKLQLSSVAFRAGDCMSMRLMMMDVPLEGLILMNACDFLGFSGEYDVVGA